MNHLERLKIEIPGVSIPDANLSIYLAEQSLSPTIEYVPENIDSKIAIYKCALAILESLANDPNLMKSYKTDDITVSEFADNLQSRIDQLDSKIRRLIADHNRSQQSSRTFYLFGQY